MFCVVHPAESRCTTLPLESARPGMLILTELMLGPAGAEAQWFEVRHLSALPLDLQGIAVRVDAAAHAIAQPVVVPP